MDNVIALKCKMCGGSLKIDKISTVGVCEFCGTKQTLPKSEFDSNVNIYNRANNLRLKCEFDKALSLYEKIVENDESDAEAHWGIVLCKYGVEYVEDPKTKKRIPTCHRTLLESVTKDLDYQMTIDYSDSDQQVLYESEARAIDKIQRETLNIVKNEKPFDIFICYKEKDSNGNRTTDSVLANDIYYNLTNDGFKVFYAAITLEDKLGQEYEPYIFAALSSSKVMLVIGTKPEYFSAVWVKNEWSRFMNLMKTDRTKTLIPCYRDMDPYDLPEEFAHLQAQDMSKIGFINDVARGIKKILHKEQTQTEEKIEKTTKSESENVESLLKRIALFLEDGEFERAEEFCEKALNIDPENAPIYFYKLLIEYECNTKEDFFDLVRNRCKQICLEHGCYTKKEIIANELSIFGSKNYKKIVRFVKNIEDSSIIDDIDKAIEIEWDELNKNDVINNRDKYIKLYSISGKVTAIFKKYDNSCDYLGVRTNDYKKASNYKENRKLFRFSFVIDNGKGKMMIYNFGKDVSGYFKREGPKLGDTVDVLGIYVGYNKNSKIYEFDLRRWRDHIE